MQQHKKDNTATDLARNLISQVGYFVIVKEPDPSFEFLGREARGYSWGQWSIRWFCLFLVPTMMMVIGIDVISFAFLQHPTRAKTMCYYKCACQDGTPRIVRGSQRHGGLALIANTDLGSVCCIVTHNLCVLASAKLKGFAFL